MWPELWHRLFFLTLPSPPAVPLSVFVSENSNLFTSSVVSYLPGVFLGVDAEVQVCAACDGRWQVSRCRDDSSSQSSRGWKDYKTLLSFHDSSAVTTTAFMRNHVGVKGHRLHVITAGKRKLWDTLKCTESSLHLFNVSAVASCVSRGSDGSAPPRPSQSWFSLSLQDKKTWWKLCKCFRKAPARSRLPPDLKLFALPWQRRQKLSCWCRSNNDTQTDGSYYTSLCDPPHAQQDQSELLIIPRCNRQL